LRQSQSGAGDDILAGNCMAIVGLYRDIYGIQPKPNRLFLEPHLTGELAGTKLQYPLRGQPYEIDLGVETCAITAGSCALRDAPPFAVNATATGLEYFPGANTDWAMSISRQRALPLMVQIERWPGNPDEPRRWTESSAQPKGTTLHIVKQLRPSARYEVKANGKTIAFVRADKAGRIEFKHKRCSAAPQELEVGIANP